MNDILLRAAIETAWDIASRENRIVIDPAEWMQEQPVGLLARVYEIGSHGVDWEATYRWHPDSLAWGEPDILAALPDGIYEEGVRDVVPEAVRQALETTFDPLRRATTLPREQAVILNAVREVAEDGPISPLLASAVRGFAAQPDAELLVAAAPSR